jgi:hypothetical protein
MVLATRTPTFRIAQIPRVFDLNDMKVHFICGTTNFEIGILILAEHVPLLHRSRNALFFRL